MGSRRPPTWPSQTFPRLPLGSHPAYRKGPAARTTTLAASFCPYQWEATRSAYSTEDDSCWDSGGVGSVIAQDRIIQKRDPMIVTMIHRPQGPNRISEKTLRLTSWTTAPGRTGMCSFAHSLQRTPFAPMTAHLVQMGRSHRPQLRFVGTLGCL